LEGRAESRAAEVGDIAAAVMALAQLHRIRTSSFVQFFDKHRRRQAEVSEWIEQLCLSEAERESSRGKSFLR
jgi:hypothetical protein